MKDKPTDIGEVQFFPTREDMDPRDDESRKGLNLPQEINLGFSYIQHRRTIVDPNEPWTVQEESLEYQRIQALSLAGLFLMLGEKHQSEQVKSEVRKFRDSHH